MLRTKLTRLRRYIYRVPWCVPQWGWPELRASVAPLITGRVVHGDDSARFAEAIANVLGTRYALPFNRGRTAISVALRALGIGPGDDVVIPAYVCQTAVSAIEDVGATPVFADIAADLNVSVDAVVGALTPQTRCVIVPHLFGQAAPIDEIQVLLKQRGIYLIDDAAQSFGAGRNGRLIGSFGDFGVVACGSGKSLAGAAGAVLVTNDNALHEAAARIAVAHERAGAVVMRLLSFWFWRRLRKYTLAIAVARMRLMRVSEEQYRPGKLSNADASIALQQLAGLERNAAQRRHNAGRLLPILNGRGRYMITDLGDDGMALKLVIVVPEAAGASRLIEELGAAGIESQRGYRPCHLERADQPQLTMTDAVWERVVCIPIETTYA